MKRHLIAGLLIGLLVAPVVWFTLPAGAQNKQENPVRHIWGTATPRMSGLCIEGVKYVVIEGPSGVDLEPLLGRTGNLRKCIYRGKHYE
jgi:hypothetical protein